MNQEIENLLPNQSTPQTKNSPEIFVEEEDFDTLLDVFRTLLKWQEDLDKGKK